MLCLPLVAFAVVSYLAFSRTLTSRTDRFLNDALTVFENELMVERRLTPVPEEAIRTTVREVRFRDLDIAVLGEGGVAVASSPPVSGRRDPLPLRIMEAVKDRVGGEPTVSTLAGPGGGYRVLVHPLALGEGRFSVVGVYPLAEVEDTLKRIRRLFLVAIPLLILLAGTGGWFLARRSFRPVSAMAARAAELSATTLHERLPVVVDDELGALARVLNDLLNRLEESFEQQRRFVADASHELRSPTAILRTEADVTLSREHRSEAEYRASLAIIRDAARRLAGVVDDLFLLARVDAGHPVVHPVTIDLDEVDRETVRIVGPLSEQRGVRVDMSGLAEAPFKGDPDLLGRLLLNLLDNAIKNSPEGGSVQVTIEDRGDAFEIRVLDAGPGVPAAVQSRIFERFFQVDSARTRNGSTLTSGAGLGLGELQPGVHRVPADAPRRWKNAARARPASFRGLVTLFLPRRCGRQRPSPGDTPIASTSGTPYPLFMKYS
jgi:signal transduction histidine kinase